MKTVKIQILQKDKLVEEFDITVSNNLSMEDLKWKIEDFRKILQSS